jgi:hypothetical protein
MTIVCLGKIWAQGNHTLIEKRKMIDFILSFFTIGFHPLADIQIKKKN